MAGVFLVLVSCNSSIYSFVERLPSLPVLLIDFECEYAPVISPNITVLHTDKLENTYKQDIIVVNTVDSMVTSPVEIQIRLNWLYDLAYKNKTVYTTTRYIFKGAQKTIPYMEYIERMIDINNIIDL